MIASGIIRPTTVTPAAAAAVARLWAEWDDATCTAAAMRSQGKLECRAAAQDRLAGEAIKQIRRIYGT